jgi:hypothetical protein
MTMAIESLCEITEDTLVTAHKAGVAYEKRNRPQVPIRELKIVAHSTGWYGELCDAWLAGAAGERRRANGSAL